MNGIAKGRLEIFCIPGLFLYFQLKSQSMQAEQNMFNELVLVKSRYKKAIIHATCIYILFITMLLCHTKSLVH